MVYGEINLENKFSFSGELNYQLIYWLIIMKNIQLDVII